MHLLAMVNKTYVEIRVKATSANLAERIRQGFIEDLII